MYFPVNFTKFLRTAVLQKTSAVTASINNPGTESEFEFKKFNLFMPGGKKGHTYLNKHAAKSCRFV